MTPAAPPSAATVWLRIGYTLDRTATLSDGSVSATAMAARKPAPPAPTITTSAEITSICGVTRLRPTLSPNRSSAHLSLDNPEDKSQAFCPIDRRFMRVAKRRVGEFARDASGYLGISHDSQFRLSIESSVLHE